MTRLAVPTRPILRVGVFIVLPPCGWLRFIVRAAGPFRHRPAAALPAAARAIFDGPSGRSRGCAPPSVVAGLGAVALEGGASVGVDLDPSGPGDGEQGVGEPAAGQAGHPGRAQSGRPRPAWPDTA